MAQPTADSAYRRELSLSRRSLLQGIAATTVGAIAGGVPPAYAAPRPAVLLATPRASAVAQRLDAFLAHLVPQRLFRGAVLVARGGPVLLSKGYDWADMAHRVPNTAHTRFRIASITKQFTAMAILQLQEQGQLHVQDPICAYLYRCPRDWQSITLHHLLTHTAGIPDYTDAPNFPTIMRRHLTPDQLIALFRDKPLDFRPGTRWRYSNSGYVLLGYVVEKVSGEPYARFLRQHIFEPLHLSDTGYGARAPTSPQYATGYASWERPAAYDMSAYADGALFSTVEDLYRWDQALTIGHPALVPPSIRRQMFTPYVATDPASGPHSVGYGYGWFIGYEGTHREIEHTGDITGFLSSNQVYPDDHLTIIVLSNLESGQGLRQITSHLAGITFGYADCETIALPCTEV